MRPSRKSAMEAGVADFLGVSFCGNLGGAFPDSNGSSPQLTYARPGAH